MKVLNVLTKDMEEDLLKQKSEFKPHDSWFDSVEDILCNVLFEDTKDCEYANVSCCFDIEASSFYEGDKKRSCMYCWVFGINGKCIRGRTWKEFIEVLQRVQEFYNLDSKRRLICYVHNLSYEMGWFRLLFNWESVFALDSRKPVKALTDLGIEFRCSYILSGYSLYHVGNNLTKYKVSKLVGDLDYKLIRHSKTPLNDKEWSYVLHDCLVVMCFIQEEIERVGSITELPLTKTGYVRNLCRDNTIKGEGNIKYIGAVQKLFLTPRTYNMMKLGFMGGFTHANHNYVGKVCENVSSFDFTSSYPSVLCSEMFPMSTPKLVEPRNENEFYSYLDVYCCLFSITFYNIREKVNFEHYISISRCIKAEHYVIDNGRVVEASVLQIVITNIDFDIISKMYEWDEYEIERMYISRKDYLPKSFIKTVLQLYEDKTTLKGVEGKEVEYQVSKGMLNALYGMAVTDPCRDEVLYDNEKGWRLEEADLPKLLEDYNTNTSRFLFYEWGIFCTAYARANLFSGILEFKDDYIYADTDSLKVFNIDNHRKYIEKYNREITRKIETCLKSRDLDVSLAKPKTIKGVKKPLGVWDEEPSIKRFMTLGAKRYLYEDYELQLHLTISGVSKKDGLNYLKYNYKTNDEIFKNFNDDLIFPSTYEVKDENGNLIDIKQGAGKLLHTYIETETQGVVKDYLGVEGEYHELTSVHLEPTSYELSMESAFLNYLKGIKEIKK